VEGSPIEIEVIGGGGGVPPPVGVEIQVNVEGAFEIEVNGGGRGFPHLLVLKSW
jgi:hypothetical protein